MLKTKYILPTYLIIFFSQKGSIFKNVCEQSSTIFENLNLKSNQPECRRYFYISRRRKLCKQSLTLKEIVFFNY